MKSTAKRALVLAALAGGTACAGEDGSAGGAGGPAMRANAPLGIVRPVDRLLAPDERGVAAVAMALAPDGGLLVADTAAVAVHRWGSGGELLARMGGPGIGPGQARSIDGLAVAGDTVWIWDATLWRITAFDPEGVLLATRRAEPRDGAVPPFRAARLPDGTWLFLERRGGPGRDADQAGDAEAGVRLVRWSPAAERWAAVPSAAAALGMAQPAEERGAGAASTALAGPGWAPDGRGGVWFADAETYQVSQLSVSGDTLARVVLPLDTPVQAALVSREGELWTAVTAPGDSTEWHAWDVFHALRLRLRLPPGHTLLGVLGDTLIVAVHDATPWVGRFLVERTPGS